MRRDLIYLSIVFISIVVLSIFIKRTVQEPFVILKENPVIEAIDSVKDSFIEIKTKAKALKKTEIQTKSETKLVSYVVKQNLANLDTLAATYESMDEYDIDPISGINSIQANLNEYIDIYNYMNGKLDLGLQALPSNMIIIPTAQASQVEFNQKLALSPTELNKQLSKQQINKVLTTLATKVPVQSALHPPKELIKVYRAPPEKKANVVLEKPIYDIYDQLLKVYGYSVRY